MNPLEQLQENLREDMNRHIRNSAPPAEPPAAPPPTKTDAERITELEEALADSNRTIAEFIEREGNRDENNITINVGTAEAQAKKRSDILVNAFKARGRTRKRDV